MTLATTSVVGGMLEVLREAGTEPLPLLFASACAGGPIVADCYRELRDELLERFDAILPVDGVLLPLHGAALAEENDDPEGEIIREVRQRVGPEIPIVVTVDDTINPVKTLTVDLSNAETIGDIGQPVFVQGACHQRRNRKRDKGAGQRMKIEPRHHH